MSSLIDITRKLQDAPIYPGSEPARIESERGCEPFNCSVITVGSHMGSHADAFSHCLSGGLSIDEMPIDNYYGSCRVITFDPGSVLDRAKLDGRLCGCERLIMHTGGDCFLTADAANYIKECGLQAVMTDALSVAPHDNELEVHQILFGAQIAVIENLTLEGVPDGDYIVAAFPIPYKGCDGAPVRAVLIDE